MEPQATPAPPKRTRTLTPEILANLEKARVKAREKRIAMGDITRTKKLIKEQTFKDESAKVKSEFEKMKSPLSSVSVPTPVSPEHEDEDEDDEPKVVVKKKSRKKPIVIVEDSESDSEDEQVVYIRRASKPKQKQILQEEPLIPDTPRSIYSGMNPNLFRRRY